MEIEETQELELDTNLETETDNGEVKDEIDWKATALRYKSQNAKLKQGRTEPKDTYNSKIEERLSRFELKAEGLSDEAIDFLMPYGGKKALENPHVKAAINSIQEQKRAESALISTDTSKSEVERKFSPEEISAMSPEELYKVLPKAKK